MNRCLRTGFLTALALAGIGCNNTALFDSIDSQFAAPLALAVDPANARAYVVNSNINYDFTDTTLSILDLTDPASPVLLAHDANPVSIPNFSGQIYLDPATGTAYIANRLSDDANDTEDALLTVNLDEASASLGTVTSYASGDNPFGMACCDAQGRIYVVSSGGTLHVYDPADLSTSVQVSLSLTLSTTEILSGAAATEVAFNADGSQAFVSSRAGQIYVFNTSEIGDTSKNPMDYILLNAGDLRGLAVSGSTLYVVDATVDATVLRKVAVDSLVAVDPDVAAPSEVDIATIQSTTISLGEDPNELVLYNGAAYVSNRGSDSVSVIDLASDTVTTTLTTGDEPFGMAAFEMGGTNYLYVTNLKDNSLTVIDLDAQAVLTTFQP